MEILPDDPPPNMKRRKSCPNAQMEAHRASAAALAPADLPRQRSTSTPGQRRGFSRRRATSHSPEKSPAGAPPRYGAKAFLSKLTASLVEDAHDSSGNDSPFDGDGEDDGIVSGHMVSSRPAGDIDPLLPSRQPTPKTVGSRLATSIPDQARSRLADRSSSPDRGGPDRPPHLQRAASELPPRRPEEGGGGGGLHRRASSGATVPAAVSEGDENSNASPSMCCTATAPATPPAEGAPALARVTVADHTIGLTPRDSEVENEILAEQEQANQRSDQTNSKKMRASLVTFAERLSGAPEAAGSAIRRGSRALSEAPSAAVSAIRRCSSSTMRPPALAAVGRPGSRDVLSRGGFGDFPGGGRDGAASVASDGRWDDSLEASRERSHTLTYDEEQQKAAARRMTEAHDHGTHRLLFSERLARIRRGQQTKHASPASHRPPSMYGRGTSCDSFSKSRKSGLTGEPMSPSFVKPPSHRPAKPPAGSYEASASAFESYQYEEEESKVHIDLRETSRDPHMSLTAHHPHRCTSTCARRCDRTSGGRATTGRCSS